MTTEQAIKWCHENNATVDFTRGGVRVSIQHGGTCAVGDETLPKAVRKLKKNLLAGVYE